MEHLSVTLSCDAMPTVLRKILTPRFSLRALLVVVTVGCVVIGWRANRLFENQKAIDALKKRDLLADPPKSNVPREMSFFGNIDVDQIALRSRRPGTGLPPEEPIEDIWGHLSDFTPLRRVVFEHMDLVARSGDGSQQGDLMPANEIEFGLCRLSNSAFHYAITHTPNLKRLTIGACLFDARALSSLSSGCDLESLEILQQSIPADAISKMSGRSLRQLKLMATSLRLSIELSDADAIAISEMPNLEALSITGNATLTSSSILSLRKCTQLKSLTLELNEMATSELDAAKKALAAALPNCELKLGKSSRR